MYPGSFNPPHYSHLELLQHTFQNCGNDLEIIAAIIFPLDDDILKSKFQHRKNTDIFTKVERVSLWKEMVPSDWYWVYDRSAKEWFEFRRRLMTDAAHDGFEIKFVVLCGSDYVTLKNAPTGALGCEEIIVSDISRAADFFSPRMAAPLAVKGYRPWEKIDVEITSLGTMAGEDAARVYGRLSFMSPSVLKSMRGH
ncbi:MAG: hypothetical protein L6R42_005548, partial [Xanthoria sp. 1 TBL-2021]